MDGQLERHRELDGHLERHGELDGQLERHSKQPKLKSFDKWLLVKCSSELQMIRLNFWGSSDRQSAISNENLPAALLRN